MEKIKINKLEIENVKRVKAVKMEPAADGLTIIGGNNRQGKTSVLDAIAWALGGDRYRPSEARRHESVIPPMLHIVMSNGLVVERRGKNSVLKVTDPSGKKGGQQLLNEFGNRPAEVHGGNQPGEGQNPSAGHRHRERAGETGREGERTQRPEACCGPDRRPEKEVCPGAALLP